MSNASTWVGSADITQGQERYSFKIDKTEVTVPFTGPLSALLAQRPIIGIGLDAFPDVGLVVVDIEIERDGGECGKMILTLATTQIDAKTLTPIGDPSYEVEFGELQKAIENHPYCGILKPGRPATAPTWQEWKLITDADYDATGFAADGTPKWTLAKYQALKSTGIDSYVIGAPIIRRTMKYLAPPLDLGTDSFKIQQPPVFAPFGALSRYQWLAGVDRCNRAGHFYERQSEWIGAEVISTDLYKHS